MNIKDNKNNNTNQKNTNNTLGPLFTELSRKEMDKSQGQGDLQGETLSVATAAFYTKLIFCKK